MPIEIAPYLIKNLAEFIGIFHIFEYVYALSASNPYGSVARRPSKNIRGGCNRTNGAQWC